jgi:hypothetical protein
MVHEVMLFYSFWGTLLAWHFSEFAFQLLLTQMGRTNRSLACLRGAWGGPCQSYDVER